MAYCRYSCSLKYKQTEVPVTNCNKTVTEKTFKDLQVSQKQHL